MSLSALSWSPSSGSAFSLSRFTCQLRPLLRRFALAGFAMVGMTYAIFSLASELALAAVTDRDYSSPAALMADVKKAVAYFPLDPNVRRTPALVVVSLVNALPLEQVLAEINDVAVNDPYAKDYERQINQLMDIMAARK